MAGKHTSPETRERLLNAATEVFANSGFEHATVRDICKRAGANIAAVNYHFGDKERLYDAIMDRALEQAQERLIPELTGAAGPAEARLAAFVRAFLHRSLRPDATHWLMRLMEREWVAPTAALDRVMERFVLKVRDYLRGIAEELLGARGTPELVSDCVVSVMSQCVHLRTGKEMIKRLRGIRDYDDATIEAMAAHVTQFSVAAMRGLSTAGVSSPAPRRRK